MSFLRRAAFTVGAFVALFTIASALLVFKFPEATLEFVTGQQIGADQEAVATLQAEVAALKLRVDANEAAIASGSVGSSPSSVSATPRADLSGLDGEPFDEMGSYGTADPSFPKGTSNWDGRLHEVLGLGENNHVYRGKMDLDRIPPNERPRMPELHWTAEHKWEPAGHANCRLRDPTPRPTPPQPIGSIDAYHPAPNYNIKASAKQQGAVVKWFVEGEVSMGPMPQEVRIGGAIGRTVGFVDPFTTGPFPRAKGQGGGTFWGAVYDIDGDGFEDLGERLDVENALCTTINDPWGHYNVASRSGVRTLFLEESSGASCEHPNFNGCPIKAETHTFHIKRLHDNKLFMDRLHGDPSFKLPGSGPKCWPQPDTVLWPVLDVGGDQGIRNWTIMDGVLIRTHKLSSWQADTVELDCDGVDQNPADAYSICNM